MLEPRVENRRWVTIAALFGASAVILGAFGTHGLRDHVPPGSLATWRVAVEYHFYHALGILALAVGRQHADDWRWSFRLWTLGILLFSGSLYALVLSGLRGLGAITPFGGLCFIAGWLFLVLHPRQRH